MRLDLTLWLEFLKDVSAYSRPFIDFTDILVAEDLDFYTDASKNPNLSFRGKFKRLFLYAKWDRNFIIENDPSITYLELYAVAAAILAWERSLPIKE